MVAVPVGISLSEELLKRIDRDRGLVSRSVWIRKLLEESLDQKQKEAAP